MDKSVDGYMKRLLKYISFGLLGVILPLLMLATILEKFVGSSVVINYIYSSPWVIALWAMLAVSAICYLAACRVYRKVALFIFHLSFVLVLVGAFVTHVSGVRGSLHLRTDDLPTTVFQTDDARVGRFPFQVSLVDFGLQFYKGTSVPMDYVSRVQITDGEEVSTGVVSVNNIHKHRGWRFYQWGYDADGNGATFAVTYDPWGIGITYAGYLGLFVAMIAFFFGKESNFRTLLASPLLKKGGLMVLFLLCSSSVAVARSPRVLPVEVARMFADVYVFYNNRVSPLETLAHDFTVKLYGNDTYEGLTPEQVFTGWIFFYDSWKEEPMIRVKDDYVRFMLGIEGKYAALDDFSDVNGYKLTDVLKGNVDARVRRAATLANEKYNLVSMVHSGSLLRLFPHSDGEPVAWYSPADTLHANEGCEQWDFAMSMLQQIRSAVAGGRYDEVSRLLGELRVWQRRVSGSTLPSDAVLTAERFYNHLNFTFPFAIVSVIVGLSCFVVYCRRVLRGELWHTKLHPVLMVFILVLFAYISGFLFLRGYISGHFPLSNGYETMLFMAWLALLMAMAFDRKFYMAVPFGLTLCGLALMMATVGGSDPKITLLTPVLQSPLLSVHVAVIMIAYSLFAFMMMNGVTALFLMRGGNEQQIEYLAVVSRLMLYPALFFLVTGILVGAVWANVSWGRYWGWDPKEVWALVTMLVYSLAMHSRSMGPFRSAVFFHVFTVVAFIAVLFTYFGVNFVLGGLHSYA